MDTFFMHVNKVQIFENQNSLANSNIYRKVENGNTESEEDFMKFGYIPTGTYTSDAFSALNSATFRHMLPKLTTLRHPVILQLFVNSNGNYIGKNERHFCTKQKAQRD